MPPIAPIDVDLTRLGIQLPRDGTGMVLVQPHLELTPDEPYRCTDQSRARHLDAIAAGLSVARKRSHDAAKTHFTVFPEYSIPIPEGVELIEQALHQQDWPTETFVIGGIDGLSVPAYAAIANEANTNVLNDPGSVPNNHWLNCGIIWAKSRDGSVERWIQPKLSPSWPEEDVVTSSMYTGDQIFVFSGKHVSGSSFRFSVLVCFDWIADVDGVKPWRAVVDNLADRANSTQGDFSLSWMFIIQHNCRPSHETFMREVNDFFDPSIAESARRERACLVFANSAGRPTPGSVNCYGHSSVIFAQHAPFRMPRCYPTFCSGGRRFRGHAVIGHHKDFLFRERGACVHSFKQLNPGTVVPGPAGVTIALKNPFVHPLGTKSDPRVPGNLVAASVKWLNDELDTVESLAVRYSDIPLAGCIGSAYEEVRSEMRSIDGTTVDQAVGLACPAVAGGRNDGHGHQTKNADGWSVEQRGAIVHLIDTLSILALVAEAQQGMSDTACHGNVSLRSHTFDVVAIRGESHDSCREHYRRALPPGRMPVLLVSRDPDNIEWSRRMGSYLELAVPAQGSERDFTQPHKLSWHIGYKDILDILRNSATIEEAKERFDEKLSE